MVEARDDAKQLTIIPKHSPPTPKELSGQNVSNVSAGEPCSSLIYPIAHGSGFQPNDNRLVFRKFPELPLLMLEQFHMS